MAESKPFSPDDAARAQRSLVGAGPVVPIVNALLAQRAASTVIIIKQDEVMSVLEQTIPRQQIFDEHMLDIEPYYREAGWNVHYSYDESYSAFWKFTRPA